MHIAHYVGMGSFHKLSKPTINLFLYCFLCEFITLQSLTSTCSGIGVTCSGMAKTNNTPDSIAQRMSGATILVEHHHFWKICRRTVVGGYAPHTTILGFILIDDSIGSQTDITYFQRRCPFSSIKVFTTGFGAYRRPITTKISGCGGRKTIGIVLIGILPSLSGRCQLAYQLIGYTIRTGFNTQSLRLHIVATGHDMDTSSLLRSIERKLDKTRCSR